MMIIEKINAILRDEITPALADFEWVKARYSGVYDSSASFGTGISYFDVSMVLQIPYYEYRGLQDVKELPSRRILSSLLSEYYTECQQSGNPWNEATFIMDREGNIEHSFVMNYQRVFQRKIDMIHTAASGLAELVYEHLSNVLPDDSVWEAGSAMLTVREGKVAFSYSITIGGVPQTQSLSTRFPRMWLEYYTLVNEGELKGHFPAWNTILFELPFEESDFDLDSHIRYEVQ
jgi:hypothetical protein